MYLDNINHAAISNMDLKRLKSVKVMVEKLEIPNLFLNCLKSTQISNQDTTLKNGLDAFKIECTSSNASIDVERKLSGSADVDADINLHEYNIKDQPSNDILLMNRSRSRSFSTDKHSKTTKKSCISLSDVSETKTPIFDRSTYSSPKIDYNYSDTEVNNINSNTVHNKKLTVFSKSLSSLNLLTSENVSRFKTHDLKISKELKHKNVITSKPSLCLRKKSYKLRNQPITTKSITSEPDYPSRSLRSNIKDSSCASNLKSKQSINQKNKNHL